MPRCGDVYENKVTGEYAVVLRGTEDSGDGPGIAHLTAYPDAALVGERFHRFMVKKFTVVRGRLDTRIAGQMLTLLPGQSATADVGVGHDWWNSSPPKPTSSLKYSSSPASPAIPVASSC